MRIEKLTLQSYDLSKQFDFYVETLGLELIEKKENSFSVLVGTSILVFQKSATKSYYHFAFNTSPFQIEEAFKWTQNRVPILEYEGDHILDFKSWNAKAFYFYDADYNIVEFIDRRNLEIKNDKSFSIGSLLEISEVGLPVSNILKAFEKINEQTDIDKYSGDFDFFCTAGDEHGLFIMVNRDIKKWLPTELPAKAFPFELHFSNNQEKYLLKYDGNEIDVEKKLDSLANSNPI